MSDLFLIVGAIIWVLCGFIPSILHAISTGEIRIYDIFMILVGSLLGPVALFLVVACNFVAGNKIIWSKK